MASSESRVCPSIVTKFGLCTASLTVRAQRYLLQRKENERQFVSQIILFFHGSFEVETLGRKVCPMCCKHFIDYFFFVLEMQSIGCWENSLLKQQVLKCRAEFWNADIFLNKLKKNNCARWVQWCQNRLMFSFVIFIISIIDAPVVWGLRFGSSILMGLKRKKSSCHLALETKIIGFSCWSLAERAAGAWNSSVFL